MTTSFWRFGAYGGFGLTLVPLLVGIAFLFYNGALDRRLAAHGRRRDDHPGRRPDEHGHLLPPDQPVQHADDAGAAFGGLGLVARSLRAVPERRGPFRPSRCPSAGCSPLLVVVFYALHQDFWFWREARPLVFGFLPIGLFYHAAFTASAVVCARPVAGRDSMRAHAWPVALSDRREGGTRCDDDSAARRLGLSRVVVYIGIFAFRRGRAARAPRTTSWPAARSARPCSCCRCSAPT